MTGAMSAFNPKMDKKSRDVSPSFQEAVNDDYDNTRLADLEDKEGNESYLEMIENEKRKVYVRRAAAKSVPIQVQDQKEPVDDIEQADKEQHKGSNSNSESDEVEEQSLKPRLSNQAQPTASKAQKATRQSMQSEVSK